MREEQLLFRMNFIVQDSNASTIETNLMKIIETILYDTSENSLDYSEIAEKIFMEYELQFTKEEVKKVIDKKGKNLQKYENGYILKLEYREKISSQESIDFKMNRLVRQMIEDLSLDTSTEFLKELIEKYLYYSFNQNKESILSLLKGERTEIQKFTQCNEEIRLINSFLEWENSEKNKIVYSIVSYGYIYCSLTVKKDELLANRLFKGKQFILDANVLFRLAGVNNDERMQTIKSFVDKCKEVGVSLCYTIETLDEIQRVIVNKVKWIKSLTGSQEPIDLDEYDGSQNDFYKLYVEWSKANKFDDYSAFQNYLIKLMFDVIDKLESKNVRNYELEYKDDYNRHIESLSEFKQTKCKIKQSMKSIKTDVVNFMYVKERRNKENSKDLWSTKEFIISTDQNYISWSNKIENGVPTIVLPSVWLTLMLRFAGRTDNDYKAFCSFLGLRTHTVEEVDVYKILGNLSGKVDSNDLKKQIIKEIYSNKEEYIVSDELNYDEITEKAIDKLFFEEKKEKQIALEKLGIEKDKIEKDLKEKELKKEAEDEFKIKKLVDKDTKKHFAFLRFLDSIKRVFAFIIFIILAVVTFCIVFQHGKLYSVLESAKPKLFGEMGNLLGILGITWTIIIVFAGFLVYFLKWICSENQESKYRKKRKEYYLKLFQS